MRSRISFFNGTIFKKNITHYWPLWLLFFFYLVCVIPVSLYFRTEFAISGYTAEELAEQRLSEYYNLLNDSLSPAVAFGMGLLSALAVFYYLYNVRGAHAFHALPVRREELFVTNYVSGLLFYTLPLILAFVMGACVCALNGITSLEYLLAWFLLMEGMAFYFYNMTIFVGMFTGQFFAIPILTLILNYLYVECRSFAMSVMGIISYGLSDIYANRSVSILSPLHFLFSKTGFLVEWNTDVCVCTVFGMEYVAVYAVVAAGFAVVSFFMYRRRKLELAGDVLLFDEIKPIFRWGVAGSVSMLTAAVISSSISVTGPRKQFFILLSMMLVSGIVFFFVAEMLLKRKFRVFQKKRLLECGVYSLLMALFLLAIEMDLFGMETSLPDEAEIKAAEMSFYYPVYELEPEKMHDILEIHRQVIESKGEFEAYYEDADPNEQTLAYMEFRYTLKDGTPFIRNYRIPIDEMYFADENSVVTKARKLSCDVDAFLRGNICLNYTDVKLKEISVDVFDENLDTHMITIKKEHWKDLYHAVEADIKEGNFLDKFEYELNDDFLYWNSINIYVYAKNGVKDIWGVRRGESVWPDESGVNLSLNRNCVHTLATLRKLGFINDIDRRILTSKEYEKYSDLTQEE